MKMPCTLIALSLLVACSKQPADDMQPIASKGTERQIEKDAKSIEQAADEATKLIEEDARSETPLPQ
jgi:hypothetical protein